MSWSFEVEVEEVRAEEVAGWGLDLPRPTDRCYGASLDLAGWVLGARSGAVAVEAFCAGQIFRTGVGFPRADVAAAFADAAGAERSGFVVTVEHSQAATANVELSVVLADGRRAQFAVVTLRRRPSQWCSRNDGPLVSVVIPCHNHARFLREAIESVLGQTYRRFELVVIDDGSSDNTATVAAELGVRCVSQPNRGSSGARNRGTEETMGDFLVFLDADDRLLPHALEANLDAFERRPHAALVSGAFRYINATGEPLPREASLDARAGSDGDQYAALLERDYVSTLCSVMFRRASLVAVGGFDVSLRTAVDYDLYLRLARENEIYVHSVPIFEYRRHQHNISRDYGLMLSSTLRALRSQRRWARQTKARKGAYQAGIAANRRLYGEPLAEDFAAALRRRHWSNAVNAARVLARHYPRGLLSPLRRAGTLAPNTARQIEFDDPGPS